MIILPIFDLEELPVEIADAFHDYLSSESGPLEDYVEWSLILPAWAKQNTDDDSYEAYRIVTDYILEELENSDLDDDYEYVLIRTY